VSPDSRSQISLAKTLCFLRAGFEFEALATDSGKATVIRFEFDNPHYAAGDVLAIMDGEEILFHGLIVQITDKFAVAVDRRSLLYVDENRANS